MSNLNIHDVLQRLQEQPQVQQATNWYRAQSERDRLIVRLTGWLLLAAMLFVLVFAPLIRDQQRLHAELGSKLQTYNLIADNAYRFGAVSTGKSNADGPILGKISQSARQAGIKLDRYEQDGKGLRIWIDRIQFDRFIAWTEQLQASDGIVVSQITLDADASTGWVDVRATLNPG